MGKRRCDGCLYWESVDDDGNGICHRFPPFLRNLPDAVDDDQPMTHRSGWCGEWFAKPPVPDAEASPA